jgi:signal transduction histidine kinase
METVHFRAASIALLEWSALQPYKWIWIALICAIVLLAVLSAYLQYSRTQLRRARDTQRVLSRMLINAQEKERSKLAAELHDDFSQRLAVLSLGLENIENSLPPAEESAKKQLTVLLEAASELGADLHTVSHHLHPASLESLGLVSGVGALCREFAVRHAIQVDFSSHDIPRDVSPNVALCLFRIVQEALQNFKKHSGATEAQVLLCRVGNNLRLSVCDQGAGFDPAKPSSHPGLGMRSMAERARLLGGHFEVHSQPGKGTKLMVSVPVQPQEDPGVPHSAAP